jgi:hypothetical protein
MRSNGGGPYDDLYERYVQKRETGKGYDFQHAPSGSVPPPAVTFRKRLRWWAWDRWRRMKTIRQERDRRVDEIVKLKGS